MELNPNYAPAHEYYAWLLIGLGKRAEGLAEICTAAELDPLSSQIAFEDGWHLYQSLTALKKSEAILGDNPSPPLAEEARVYAMSGRRAKALEALDRLRALAKHAQVSKYVIAVVYAALGDKDRAFANLNLRLAEHAFLLTFLKTEPALDPLRSDARFQELVAKMKL